MKKNQNFDQLKMLTIYSYLFFLVYIGLHIILTTRLSLELGQNHRRSLISLGHLSKSAPFIQIFPFRCSPAWWWCDERLFPPHHLNPDRRRSSRGGFGDLIFDLFLPSPVSPSRGGLVLSATL
jgi:hypothetical protein